MGTRAWCYYYIYYFKGVFMCITLVGEAQKYTHCVFIHVQATYAYTLEILEERARN